MQGTKSARAAALDDLDLLIEGFELALHAGNKSFKTVETYMDSCRQFAAFLADKGMPRDVAAIRREHIEAWIVSLLERWKPATASNRFRALQQFFKWCVEEGEITESPMRNLKPPIVPVEAPDVLTLESLQKLLKVCAGDAFEDVRDTAMLRMFMTTGARLAEITNLSLDDVVITRDERYIEVLGKGRRRRRLPLDNRTQRAVNRYLRERRKFAKETDALWIGKRGPLTVSGTYRIVARRAEEAGLPHVHPHQLRHSFAHAFLEAGGQEGDLMQLAGWASRSMVQRYGAALASERAHEAYKRLGIGDRL